MKFLSLILVITILGSTMDFCEENNEEISTSTETSILYEADDCEGFDLCSPFCSCQCCHSYTFLTYPTPSEYKFSTGPISPGLGGFYDQVVHSIWEPPKIQG